MGPNDEPMISSAPDWFELGGFFRRFAFRFDGFFRRFAFRFDRFFRMFRLRLGRVLWCFQFRLGRLFRFCRHGNAFISPLVLNIHLQLIIVNHLVILQRCAPQGAGDD